MATVKVKFRASSVPGKEGTLYYHLIHQRCQRWISTDYHVFPDEWNDKKSAIIASNRNNRQAHLAHPVADRLGDETDAAYHP